jgi:hypothetical protein
MPQIFKALVTVTIWLMFIAAWLAILMPFILGGIVGGGFFSSEPPPMDVFVGLALSVGFAFAGGFLMLVRKKLE